MNKLLKIIIDNGLKDGLIDCNFGLEKENIRVDREGKLSKKPHPKAFKEDNKFIMRDFADAQVEMITPICNSIEETFDFMENLNNIVNLELEDEFLWPQSNPPILPEDEREIKVANLEDKEAKEYRENLVKKYGAKRQLVSGVHYNFSFRDEFIEKLYKIYSPKVSIKEFKNELYFKIGRNFLKHKWFLNYLTGASPVFHKSYLCKCTKRSVKLGRDDYYFKGVNSLRNSKCGYRNEEDFFVSHNNVYEYVRDIKRLIDDKCIQAPKEYYSSIRFKSKRPYDILNSIEQEGVEYLEIRLLDLDPRVQVGVSKDSLYLIHLFLMLMLFKDDEEYTLEVHKDCIENDSRAVKNCEMNTLRIDGKEIMLREAGLSLLNEMDELREIIFKNDERFLNIVALAKTRFEDSNKTIASKLIEDIKESNYINYFMDIAKKNTEVSKRNAFRLVGYENLELSTQILIIEALKNGVSFEILDEQENFIELKYKNHKEYVKQATKTGKDTYITALIMENKLVTKKVLNENNIRVPEGGDYSKIEKAKDDFYKYEGNAIVIKPKNTNFGIGISIFKNPCTREEYEKAIDMAFKEDTSILIEEFIMGKEYRFLVIDNEVVGVLHRVPANVIGDGEHNIEELIKEKNKNPLRGKGYKTPLEKLRITESEKMFLKNSIKKDFSYVPKENEVVYLRENSNISTGGDSIDFTDEIDESYKKIAISAAKAANAKISGIDMMIRDIKNTTTEDGYAIIEINFNPAIHIHCFPYKGKNRKAGEKVLKLLFNEI